MKKREVIFVDIDGTICNTEGGYANAKPIPVELPVMIIVIFNLVYLKFCENHPKKQDKIFRQPLHFECLSF